MKLVNRSFGLSLTEPIYGSATHVEGDGYVAEGTNAIDLDGTFTRDGVKVEFTSIHDLVTKTGWSQEAAQAFVERIQTLLKR